MFLLLFAQQAALTHAIWHYAAGAAHEHQHEHVSVAVAAAGHEGEESDFQSTLCVYHVALGESLGFGVAAAAPGVQAVAADAPASAITVARLKAEAIAAVSRGPPVLLQQL